jgi:ribosomal protein S18 acetylase RimI-like enzyme
VSADLEIRPFASEAEADACARMMSATDPWKALGRGREACLRMLQDVSRERYAAFRDGALVGFLVLNLRGAFVGYLQTICIDEPYRGRGLGARLIAFAEERIFREWPNVFLCVSSFNPDARRLYERLGYRAIGTLTDYIVAGNDEVLMRKTRGPLDGYRP